MNTIDEDSKVRAHTTRNANETWLDYKGAWCTYALVITIGHLFLLSLPFFTTATVWTVTTVVHNVAMYFFLHHVKGAPFETYDEGKSRRMTHWEQIDAGELDTGTRKFLTLAPILLFIFASYYSDYNHLHFVINFLSLMLGVLPKVSQTYGW